MAFGVNYSDVKPGSWIRIVKPEDVGRQNPRTYLVKVTETVFGRYQGALDEPQYEGLLSTKAASDLGLPKGHTRKVWGVFSQIYTVQ